MSVLVVRKLLSTRSARREDVAHLITRMALKAAPGEMLDPFLLLAHHGPQHFPPNNRGLPFGPHPHRGFETVTFIIEGTLLHRDSGGHESVIGPGGIQWMTASAGVVHSETSPDSFLKAGGSLEILQLWLNLPGRLKMSPSRYVGLHAHDIPRVALSSDGELRLISGVFEGVRGPVDSLTGVFMSTVRLDGLLPQDLPAPSGRTILLYVVSGEAVVDDTKVPAGTLATFKDEGDIARISAPDGALLLYGHADPLNEPVVARGPFIMNTDAQIEEAFRDFRTGRLGAA